MQNEKKRGFRKRGIISIVQFEKHPVTGESLISEEIVEEGLKKSKTFEKWFYIWHDKDVFSQSDIDKKKQELEKEYLDRQNEFVNEEDGTVSISLDAYIEREMNTTYSYMKVGEKKGKHMHIIIYAGENAVNIEKVADYFGIPMNLVNVIPGKRNKTWYDCIRYLTHETPSAKREGKYVYPHEEVFGNVDYDAEIEECEEMEKNFGAVFSPKEKLFMEVLNKGKSPKECLEQNPLLYFQHSDKIKKLFGDYLENLSQPAYRINIYIEGEGGEGKGQASRAIARSLFPDKEKDSDIYFKVGAKNVTFEGYQGQPVIIWDDFRANELINTLDGVGNVFEVFNPFPEQEDNLIQNVKYSHVNLVNKVNIVNSVQPYKEFLDGLAGEYKDRFGNEHKAEDKKQSYRRFPIVVSLHSKCYDVLLNEGYLNGNRNYTKYQVFLNNVGNFAHIAEACKGKIDLKKEIFKKAVVPIIEKYEIMEKAISTTYEDEETIRQKFDTVGTVVDEKEPMQMELLDLDFAEIDDDEKLPFD